MKYWSLFYTASPAGLSGRPGFGVRTATEGTPAEIINALQTDTSLFSYSFGTYQDAKWMSEPSAILSFPRRYFFRRLEGTGYCLFGRGVYAGYDFPYYSTKRPNRPGNYIINVIAFESWPGRDVFSLLLEDGQNKELRFLPEDFSPRLDNEAMLELMTGKPSPLPVEERPLGRLIPPVPSKSIDLYFSYLEALGKGLPMVVKAAAAETSAVAAGFLSILPDSLAAKTTFETNHQGGGFAKNCAVTFVNEYSISEISAMTCLYVDLVSGKRNVTPVETLWRAMLERENENGGVSDALTEWIGSPAAVKNAGKSQELNLALFDYCRHPEKFSLGSIGVPDFLGTLSSLCRDGLADASVLNTLVADRFREAASSQDIVKAVAAAEKVGSAGMLAEDTLALARARFTAFAKESVDNLSFAVRQFKGNVLGRYLVRKDLSPLDEIARECLERNVQNTKEIVSCFEPSAQKRVAMFVELARRYPQLVRKCREQIDNDRDAAAAVDYISEFHDFLDNPDFAPFFFDCLKARVETASPRETVIKFNEMAQKNTAFAQKLFADDSIHQKLYSRFEPEARPGSAEDISFIESNVLELLPQDAPSCRKWRLLRNVLASDCDGEKPVPFYALALRLKADDAVKKVAPKCFKEVEPDEIRDFLKKIGGMFSEEEILSFAKSAKPLGRRRFLVEIARMYGYDYDRIISLAPEFGVSDKDSQRQLMKSDFPSLYKARATKEFFGKIKSLFCKKESAGKKEPSCEKKAADEKAKARPESEKKKK